MEQPRICQKYLDLLTMRAGANGKYQYILTFTFVSAWLVAGAILLSTPFIFWQPKFDCRQFGLLTKDCQEYVCRLPEAQWPNFINKAEQQKINTLTRFETFYCDKEIYLNLYQGSAYLGTFIGYLFINYRSDNHGRKKITWIAWTICTVGCVVLAYAQCMWMASLGLFFCGMGADSAISITISIMMESYDNNLRQKHNIIIQASFLIGGLIMTGVFWKWRDWQVLALYVFLIPSAITLLMFFKFLKQTPMYLLREKNTVALRQLNKIGFINKKRHNTVSMKDIIDIKSSNKTETFRYKTSIRDIFLYESLRLITILQILLSIAIYFIYYGIHLTIDQLGFDIYTTEAILDLSQLVSYIPILIFIQHIKRQKTAIILLLTATALSITLSFIPKPYQCEFCNMGFVQLGFVFPLMFCISGVFVLMTLYQAELYPTRVRNTASGVFGVFGTLGSTSSPIVIGILKRQSFNYFAIFAALSIIGVGCCIFTRETKDSRCPEQPDEVIDSRNNSRHTERSEQFTQENV